MNKRKNKLDEMQEQKLLKIERNGMWVAFWGLFAIILIQSLIGKGDIIGESIVFMCLAVYTVLACLKNGIWDRKLEPNIKTNIIISSISGVLCGLTFFISSYLKYAKLLGSIATGIIMLVQVFALAFVTLTIFSAIYKKRVKKIEENCEAKSDEAN
ncbi:DUF6773 family protein [Clostridium cagae]|uniref:DUF6773 family protein n=1 Tax=Clostridium cagae TaxID=2080751 RepID=UPI0013F0E760|nr:hypothetical protein [Clostridium botulinum]NFH70195.1 hypothetical protein [Clostridium botulinum]NFI56040.1 hypothetical protein [Clostridium botulinum]NFP01689.1 hypothetical protein [Clostridium botulinum]NFT92066.1 hypothetical protein [Clostridium botulinum]